MLNDINSVVTIIVGLSVIFANIFVSIQFIWRIAQRIGRLERRVEKCEHDLNNLKQICKGMVTTETWKLQIQITHIQEHLENETNYHAPSFQRYEYD